MRSLKVGKTGQGKPMITLFEHGQVMLSRPVVSVLAGNRLGAAWVASQRKES